MGLKLNFGSHSWKQALKNIFRALIHTIWHVGYNLCKGQLFAPKLKFLPDPVMS